MVLELLKEAIPLDGPDGQHDCHSNHQDGHWLLTVLCVAMKGKVVALERELCRDVCQRIVSLLNRLLAAHTSAPNEAIILGSKVFILIIMVVTTYKFLYETLCTYVYCYIVLFVCVSN